MKRIIIFIGLTLFFQLAKSQGIPLDTIKKQLYEVNRVFDSSYFLQFTVKYQYETDTILGNFDKSEKTGNYIVKGASFYYKLDNIEYMQNDSLSLSLFHGDKIIILSKKQIDVVSRILPLRELVDSVVSGYADYYHISVSSDNDAGEVTVSFITDSVNALYSSFSITYDADTKYLHRLIFNYTEMEALSQAIPDSDTSSSNYIDEKIVPRKKKMTMLFSDYHLADVDFGLFNQDNYILFDHIKKIYTPIEKYRGYQLYVNGIDQGDYDVTENPEVNDNNK
jgi:hypothetical protein